MKTYFVNVATHGVVQRSKKRTMQPFVGAASYSRDSNLLYYIVEHATANHASEATSHVGCGSGADKPPIPMSTAISSSELANRWSESRLPGTGCSHRE